MTDGRRRPSRGEVLTTESFPQQTGRQLPHKSKGAVRACTPSIAEELGDLGGALTLKLQQPWLTDPCTRSAPGPTTTLALY